MSWLLSRVSRYLDFTRFHALCPTTIDSWFVDESCSLIVWKLIAIQLRHEELVVVEVDSIWDNVVDPSDQYRTIQA
jgi:hypothetical protein